MEEVEMRISSEREEEFDSQKAVIEQNKSYIVWQEIKSFRFRQSYFVRLTVSERINYAIRNAKAHFVIRSDISGDGEASKRKPVSNIVLLRTFLSFSPPSFLHLLPSTHLPSTTPLPPPSDIPLLHSPSFLPPHSLLSLCDFFFLFFFLLTLRLNLSSLSLCLLLWGKEFSKLFFFANLFFASTHCVFNLRNEGHHLKNKLVFFLNFFFFFRHEKKESWAEENGNKWC